MGHIRRGESAFVKRDFNLSLEAELFPPAEEVCLALRAVLNSIICKVI